MPATYDCQVTGEPKPERRKMPRDPVLNKQVELLFNGFHNLIDNWKLRQDLYQEGYTAAMRQGFADLVRELTAEPEWIVNDLGELGVKVAGRLYFLYKGESIEYGHPSVRGSNEETGSIVLHDDGTPLLWRPVGKREFGEVQWPASWLKRGFRDDRYTDELVYSPGLSDGVKDDPKWKWQTMPLLGIER